MAVAITAFLSAGCRQQDEPARTGFAAPVAAGALHPVTIHRPAETPRLQVEGADGTPLQVACGTCHLTRTPRRDLNAATELTQVHSGLLYEHGGMACLSCHNPADYDSLRLASDERVTFTDAMRLCAQCHGVQYRDYRNGSHGGMTGYWDLSRGPRERNGCLFCHDPHAPAYQGMKPAPGPRDRFLAPGHASKESDHE